MWPSSFGDGGPATAAGASARQGTSPSFADRDYARIEDNVAFLSQKKANGAE